MKKKRGFVTPCLSGWCFYLFEGSLAWASSFLPSLHGRCRPYVFGMQACMFDMLDETRELTHALTRSLLADGQPAFSLTAYLFKETGCPSCIPPFPALIHTYRCLSGGICGSVWVSTCRCSDSGSRGVCTCERFCTRSGPISTSCCSCSHLSESRRPLKKGRDLHRIALASCLSSLGKSTEKKRVVMVVGESLSPFLFTFLLPPGMELRKRAMCRSEHGGRE